MNETGEKVNINNEATTCFIAKKIVIAAKKTLNLNFLMFAYL